MKEVKNVKHNVAKGKLVEDIEKITKEDFISSLSDKNSDAKSKKLNSVIDTAREEENPQRQLS